ncbi:MAG TPA: hypothetical protein VJP84_15085 [Steroidobacteraceae bacterium]|jgi:hypothetical protein|nr:hypothetical protein [Steroidobacteraceae bacterium]
MRLRKSLLLFVALAATSVAFAADEYCEGYKVGYREGYAQVTGAEPQTLSPLCPLKRVRADGERRSEYQRGYDKGLKDGIRDGSH